MGIELVARDLVTRGRGRGGSLVLNDTTGVDQEGVLNERSLYAPASQALSTWICQHYGPKTFDWIHPEVVGDKGGTRVGGRWRRTDLAAVSIRRFTYSPVPSVETFAVEVKTIANLDVAAIYETAESSGGATYGYLLVHRSVRQDRRSTSAQFLRLERAASAIGVICFESPSDVETWECELEATRRPHDPAASEAFIERTLSRGTRDELVRRLGMDRNGNDSAREFVTRCKPCRWSPAPQREPRDLGFYCLPNFS